MKRSRLEVTCRMVASKKCLRILLKTLLPWPEGTRCYSPCWLERDLGDPKRWHLIWIPSAMIRNPLW